MLAALLAVAGLCGCEKTAETECVYDIMPVLQEVKGGSTAPVFDNVVVYGYKVDVADTLLWYVRSYEDAAQGILSSTKGGETRQPDFTGNIEVDLTQIIYRIQHGLDLKSAPEEYHFDDYARLQLGPLSPGEMMIVACDLDGHGMESKIYAWRGVSVVAGMDYVSLQLKLCPWEERSRYIDSKWVIANDNPYVAPPPPTPPEDPEDPENPENPDNPDDGDNGGETDPGQGEVPEK